MNRRITREFFEQLLETSELRKVDFKREHYLLRNEKLKSEFLKDIIAMANTAPLTEEAFIVIGVKEHASDAYRERVGVTGHPNDSDLQNIVKDKVQPVPNFIYTSHTFDGKQYGIIRIEPCICQARVDFGVVKKGVFYTRKGTQNTEASPADLEALFHARLALQTQSTMSQIKLTADEVAAERSAGAGAAKSTRAGEGLGRGDTVHIRFDTRLNTKWKDPLAIIIGIVTPDGGLRDVRWPLKLRDHPNASIEADYRALCIPDFSVEMEWREASYVLDNPMWRAIKQHAVRRFLAKMGAQPAEAAVRAAGKKHKGYVYLNCPSYDAFLNKQWFYYRGVEAALRRTGVASNPEVSRLSEDDLLNFVAEILLPSHELTRLIPDNYASAFKKSQPDGEAVAIVLRGLIDEAAGQDGAPAGKAN